MATRSRMKAKMMYSYMYVMAAESMMAARSVMASEMAAGSVTLSKMTAESVTFSKMMYVSLATPVLTSKWRPIYLKLLDLSFSESEIESSIWCENKFDSENSKKWVRKRKWTWEMNYPDASKWSRASLLTLKVPMNINSCHKECISNIEIYNIHTPMLVHFI